MELSELWFVLIAVLFTGFFFLEGFDFGVGMSTRLLAKTEGERRVLINTIGPFWDANEVWLLTAGGAMFAAFPHWYATMFSGYYLPLVIVLLALIGRGVSFEYRSKVDNEKWKRVWDNAIFYGSLLPPFLLGVAFSGLLKGLPIDQNMEMKAGLFDMVNPYTLVGGITVTMLCFVHGLIFISLKTEGGLRDRAKATARRLLRPLALLVVLFVVMTVFMTDIFQGGRSVILGPLAVLGAAALAGAGYFLSKAREGWAFAMTALVIVALLAIG
ncbi:MAG: cytochrome d ubiquinol oxidase subunit II, partial [Bacillaceae bacterium G1]